MLHKVQPRLPLQFCGALLGGAVVLIGLAAGAAAQTASMKAMRQACMPDYKTYCSGIAPGGGRIVACLQQHAQTLSPACLQALQLAQAAHKAQGGA